MFTRDPELLVKWSVGSEVNSVAVSHDSSRIVSGSDDGHVRVWDVHTGALLLGPLEGHSNWVRSVGWSHDDTYLVSGSVDHGIRIWDGRTGNSVGEPLTGHAGTVWSVAFSPDSTHIVSGSEDKIVRIWDIGTGAHTGRFLGGHAAPVWSVVFTPDNTRVISGSWDRTIRIWDARTGAALGDPLTGHTDPIYSVAVSSDGARIVSGSGDNTILLWDARSGTPIGQPFRGHTNVVRSVAFSPDSRHIVSGSMDNAICIWDVRTCTLVGEPLTAETRAIRSAVFSPDSTHIICGSEDGSICVWKAPQSTSSADMVTSSMPTQQMLEYLLKHGCIDLSSSIDPTQYSASAVASGGFADVWQACMANGILVAVKCLRLNIILRDDLKGMKRAARELYHWSKARHENIQELLGIVVFQGRLGMVSLWMENGNLQEYIQKNPSVERYPLCLQVTKGVSYLHGIEMVHGDLKAINILVSVDGIVKISDFDYSMVLDSTLRFSETSKTGGGTLRWMAPELLHCREDDDSPPAVRNTKTDVYALGMTMLEIISGKLPYHEYPVEMTIVRAVDKKQPPKRPKEFSVSNEQSNHMWALLLECWDHDPASRPNALSVLSTLQRFVV